MLKDILYGWTTMQGSILPALTPPVTVSTLAPDLIEDTSDNQINLFLYRVTPNTGWCNTGLPSRDWQGNQTDNQPLALDLHYLLTAYAKTNFYAEALLGFAMQVLHDTPVLSRDSIRKRQVEWAKDQDPLLKALAKDSLADQAEQIKIVPQALSPDEISKLWTATEMHYRPTAAYLATVVLIQREEPRASPLPVLTRRVTAVPGLIPITPILVSATPPKGQASVVLNDTLALRGYHLNGSNILVHFTNYKLRKSLEFCPNNNPQCINENESGIDVLIDPDPAKEWHAGIYGISVILKKVGEKFLRSTNELSISLAPTIKPPIDIVRSADGTVTFTVTCDLEVLPAQKASLTVGGTEIQAEQHTDPTFTLKFIDKDLPAGSYKVRLRIDGVDSLLVLQSEGGQPIFDPSQVVDVPP
jgi:hypothetical protein